MLLILILDICIFSQDGHPPLGWPDTLAYLVLPVLLVVSQYISVQIMQPPQVPLTGTVHLYLLMTLQF